MILQGPTAEQAADEALDARAAHVRRRVEDAWDEDAAGRAYIRVVAVEVWAARHPVLDSLIEWRGQHLAGRQFAPETASAGILAIPDQTHPHRYLLLPDRPAAGNPLGVAWANADGGYTARPDAGRYEDLAGQFVHADDLPGLLARLAALLAGAR